MAKKGKPRAQKTAEQVELQKKKNREYANKLGKPYIKNPFPAQPT